MARRRDCVLGELACHFISNYDEGRDNLERFKREIPVVIIYFRPLILSISKKAYILTVF